jgi:1-phosphofructokinase family hexose kinase
VIHSFGGATSAVLISGGDSGKRLERYLCAYGYRFRAVPVENEIRTNFTVTDKQGLTVNLNEVGPSLSREEVARVERAVRENLERASWLLMCGSLPPGVPTSFYGKLAAKARQKKVKTLLHASGDALLEALEERPTVVELNQQEAERLLGRTLLTRTHYLEAAERIRSMGPESVVLTLGSHGAVGAYAERMFEVLPPRIDAVCPIGSGDALAAAYVWAMRRSKTGAADALRWGVAAGTASARLPGMSFASLEQTREMYSQVEIRAVE